MNHTIVIIPVIITFLVIMYSVRRKTLIDEIDKTEKEIKDLLDKTANSISGFSLENTNLDNALLDLSKDQLIELLEVLEDYGKQDGVLYNGFRIRREGDKITVTRTE